MLLRLEIRGLVVIEHADIEFGPGLTAITGETGAGKTVLTNALALLGGAPADAKLVRPDHRHALVQATFAVPEGFWDALEPGDPAASVRDLAEDESEVVVARRVPVQGRSRSTVDGQATTTDAVASFVKHLVRFSSQGDQRRLASPNTQMQILDRFLGEDVEAAARDADTLRGVVRSLERALGEAVERQEYAKRHRDELAHTLEEIDAVCPEPTELADLHSEKRRLLHQGRLGAAALLAAEALSPDNGDGAIALTEVAERAIAEGSVLDPTLGAGLQELVEARSVLQETAHTLRGYLDTLESEPGRLDVVEGRLADYARLERRYGPGIERVLAIYEEARSGLALLDHSGIDDGRLQAQLDEATCEATLAAVEVHTLRQAGIPAFEEAVGAELAGLGMPRAHLRVELRRSEGTVPQDVCGFHLRLNPGLPESALAQTASGGELSRILLALHSITAVPDGTTWLFDEIDAGVGGTTATALAARLVTLSERLQTIVVTHLPQVAAAARAHLRLAKGFAGDDLTTTRIEALTGQEVQDELVRMMGATPDDTGAHQHARGLMSRAG